MISAPRSIWVDFNDIDRDNHTTTLSEFGPDDLTVGESILAYGDGLTRMARVVAITDDVVTLRLESS